MFYRALEKKLTQYPSTKWDNGLMRTGKGHTAEANKHEVCHCSRTSSSWYAALAIGGKLDEATGSEMLSALIALQDRNKNSFTYGCTKWYAEESRVIDTNAAFFSQLPLLTVMLFERDRIPASHQKIILDIFSAAIHWYNRELDNAIFYYTNKIVSDGAMLLGIANIIEDSELFEKGLSFFEKWLTYTENDGWGWGENMSIGYNNVIFASLKVALSSLGSSEREKAIAQRITAVMDGQKALFKYFKGYEFTPAIRNYNFDGKSKRKGLVSQISGLSATADELAAYYIWDFITFGYLFKDEFKEQPEPTEEKSADIRLTKVYKDAVAYSCVMKNGSIGSMNVFPVIPGSYQHKGWGLGWQCMPVNFTVYEGEVGYLRRIVQNESETAYHPKHAYLSPCLFSDFPYPKVLTRAKQQKNIVIAKRSIEKIHNTVGEIADELFIPSFSGKCESVRVNGRDWAVIAYENATVFVSSTQGVICPEGSVSVNEGVQRTEAPVPMEITCDKALSVKQTAFKSDTATMLACERTELGWIIIYEDKKIESPENYLSAITVSERVFNDGTEPRTPPYRFHEITLTRDGETLIEYRYDPYI